MGPEYPMSSRIEDLYIHVLGTHPADKINTRKCLCGYQEKGITDREDGEKRRDSEERGILLFTDLWSSIRANFDKKGDFLDCWLSDEPPPQDLEGAHPTTTVHMQLRLD